MKSLVSPWLPRPDEVFLTDNPQVLIAQGKVANIPMVSGTQTAPCSLDKRILSPLDCYRGRRRRRHSFRDLYSQYHVSGIPPP